MRVQFYPASVFPRPQTSLYLIISRANCHVSRKCLRPTTLRDRLLNLRPLIPRAEYRQQRRRSRNAKTAQGCESADTHDLIMFIVGGSGNHARGQSTGICIMRNYTCANSARNTVANTRAHARTHALRT